MSAAPKLTPHQANTLGRLRSYSRHEGRWVPLHIIGSKGALDKLVEKGLAERHELRGPRGGTHYQYRPLLAVLAELDQRAQRRAERARARAAEAID